MYLTYRIINYNRTQLLTVLDTRGADTSFLQIGSRYQVWLRIDKQDKI